MELNEIFKDPVERGLIHHDLCKQIERREGVNSALKFHKKYVEIEKHRGVNAAMIFQNKRAKELRLSLIEPPGTDIKVEGNKITIRIKE